MDESMKNPIKIGVIVVCFVAAVLIFWATRKGGGGGIDDISDSEVTWVICLNKSCNAQYETSLKEYYKFLRDNVNPMGPTPALICKECGEPSVYKAEKCQNPACGIVFRSGSVPNDHADRCPKCGQSATEESREARKREMAGE
jgi:hypothetical protein